MYQFIESFLTRLYQSFRLLFDALNRAISATNTLDVTAIELYFDLQIKHTTCVVSPPENDIFDRNPIMRLKRNFQHTLLQPDISLCQAVSF